MPDTQEIYRAARDLKESDRSTYLDEVCRDNALRRARIEAMIEHGVVPDGGALPLPDFDDPGLKLRPDELSAPGENEGATIGRYKLLQRIGEGGMGVVYMAEQDVPVRRRVALKIIKLGMDTRQVVARFEAERQALAMMDHPNIAKMLDAGTTESGRPFFVMELVQGIPITEFCDRNQLPLRERIELFLPVCRAIQSAHQKGIMHRDIKPSNVMVTLHYGDPMPKVIDFGVAKAVSQRLTEKTVFTHYGAMIGTPAYMSPEQAEMSSMDVDMRTDVYSLGVLLYELLTGSTPFPQERLRSLGFGQIQKVLAEEEPEKPSTRVSTLWREKKPAPTWNQGLSGDHASRAITGDLDWIVMKCLEKDRRRRYDTVNGLAMDLTRYLSNEPVLARPPSAAYRFQKAFERHRVAFIGVAAVMVALAVGLGFATRQAVRARRAEALALERRADAEAISKFLTEVFQSPDPERAGYSFTVAEALGHAAARLDTDLADQPERRVMLQETLGDTYEAIGLHRESVPLRERVIEHHRKVYGLEDERTVQIMANLAHSLRFTHRYEESLGVWKDILEIRERTLGAEHPTTLSSSEALATVMSEMGHVDDATARFERLLETRRRLQGPEHQDTLSTLGSLAVHYGRSGNPEKELALNEEVLRLRRQTLGANHPETLTSIANLAATYHQRRRAEEAFALQTELIAARRKVLGPGHPQTLMAMHYLAFFEQDRRPEEAVRLHREVAALRRQHLGPENPDTILSLHYLALACLNAGLPEEARSVREEVVRLRRRANGVDHPHTVDSMARLACSDLNAGRETEALELLRECASHLSEDTWLSLRVTTLLAWYEQDAALAQAARRVLFHASTETQPAKLAAAAEVALLRPLENPDLAGDALNLARRAAEMASESEDRQRARYTLGLALYRNGRFSEAADLFQSLSADAGDQDTLLARTVVFHHAAALHRLGRVSEARTLFEKASRGLPPVPKSGDLSRDGNEARRVVAWLAQREAQQLVGDPRSNR
ncbi:MAG: tetratricopeptide repeat protein [Verrucomicrobiales bacterium]|nr:tetratricopeptide repeat protein [Verrucomicrobiales bacterium]